MHVQVAAGMVSMRSMLSAYPRASQALIGRCSSANAAASSTLHEPITIGKLCATSRMVNRSSGIGMEKYGSSMIRVAQVPLLIHDVSSLLSASVRQAPDADPLINQNANAKLQQFLNVSVRAHTLSPRKALTPCVRIGPGTCSDSA